MLYPNLGLIVGLRVSLVRLEATLACKGSARYSRAGLAGGALAAPLQF